MAYPTPLTTRPRAAEKAGAGAEGFALMDTCKFHARTMDEARMLSRLVAQAYPDPERAEPGIHELLLNAIEHGCLGIGHALKLKLAVDGVWEQEVRRRESLPENRERRAELVLARKQEGLYVVVTDPGDGFDWKSWMTIDPARADESVGRGIARARSLSFDSLTYNTKGNQAVAFATLAPDLKW